MYCFKCATDIGDEAICPACSYNNKKSEQFFIFKVDEKKISFKKKTYYNSLHPVKVDGKYGYANAKNEVVIKAKYDRAKPFSCDRAKVYYKGKFGFIDRAGNEVIQVKYEKARDFKNGKTSVTLNGKKLSIDIYGNIIV